MPMHKIVLLASLASVIVACSSANMSPRSRSLVDDGPWAQQDTTHGATDSLTSPVGPR
jgi:hypothetical protein